LRQKAEAKILSRPLTGAVTGGDIFGANDVQPDD